MKLVLLISVLFTSTILSAQYQYDMTIDEPCQLTYVTPGTYVVKTAVRKLGTQAVTLIRLNWQLDNGPINTELINDFEVYTNWGAIDVRDRVVSSFPVTFSNLGDHTITAWITDINGTNADQNPSNDVVSKVVHVVPYVPTKRVMIDYYTHTLCGPCGSQGAPQVKAIEGQYPGIADGISIHAAGTDPYTTPESQLLNDDMGVGAHPRIFNDRFKAPYLSFMDPVNGYEFNIPWRLTQDRIEYAEPVEVDFTQVSYDPATRILSGQVEATFYDDMNEDLAFICYVTEDSILGYQAGDANPNNYWHRNVFRTGLSAALGAQNSLPAQVNNGQTYTWSFSYVLNQSWNEDQIHLVGGVVHQSTSDINNRRVLNSRRRGLQEAIALSVAENDELAFSAWPTLVNDQLSVRIPEALSRKARLELVSLDGKVEVVRPSYGGQLVLGLDMSAKASGIYFVRYAVDGQQFTQKVIKR